MRKMAAFFLIVAALFGGIAPAAAQTAEPAIRVVPETVAAGQTVKVQGAGFRARARLATWFTAVDQSVLSGPYAFVSTTGAFELDFRIPVGAIGGRWAVTVYDPQDRSTTVAFFEVQGRTAGADDLAQARVAPSVGVRGSQFAFSAQGFDVRERVSYWFTGPDGQVAVAYPEGTRANSDGRIDIVWQAPADATAGVWVITLQGVESMTARAVPFRIE